MPRHRERRHPEVRRATSPKVYVAVAVSVLVVIVLLLALKVGQQVWPGWLVTYRNQVIGLLGLGLLGGLCALPIIIEADRRPRRLSGPGHNPEQGPGSR